MMCLLGVFIVIGFVFGNNGLVLRVIQFFSVFSVMINVIYVVNIIIGFGGIGG